MFQLKVAIVCQVKLLITGRKKMFLSFPVESLLCLVRGVSNFCTEFRLCSNLYWNQTYILLYIQTGQILFQHNLNPVQKLLTPLTKHNNDSTGKEKNMFFVPVISNLTWHAIATLSWNTYVKQLLYSSFNHSQKNSLFILWRWIWLRKK